MAEYIERYTRLNDELGCYTVPLLMKEDGSSITFGIFTEREERLNRPHENIVISPKIENVFGEFVDRLAELENKIEFGELVEVRHGEWVTERDYLKNTTCSLCNYWVETPYGKTAYCPNCGAKMDGKGDK